MSQYTDHQEMSAPATLDASTTVLCVDGADELDRIESELGEYDWLTVRTATEVNETLSHVDDVDCAVCDVDGETGGVELIERIRERHPTLPVVLFTSASLDEIGDVLDLEEVEYLRKDGCERTVDLLARRVRNLAENRRLSETVRQLIAAVDTAQKGLCIVDPDGAIVFANYQYAQRFGYTQECLLGRQWHDLYPESVIERIESTAFPTADDGWRWTGDCTGCRADGTTFVATTTVVGLDDGSRVFTVATPAAE